MKDYDFILSFVFIETSGESLEIYNIAYDHENTRHFTGRKIQVNGILENIRNETYPV